MSSNESTFVNSTATDTSKHTLHGNGYGHRNHKVSYLSLWQELNPSPLHVIGMWHTLNPTHNTQTHTQTHHTKQQISWPLHFAQWNNLSFPNKHTRLGLVEPNVQHTYKIVLHSLVSFRSFVFAVVIKYSFCMFNSLFELCNCRTAADHHQRRKICILPCKPMWAHPFFLTSNEEKEVIGERRNKKKREKQ